MSNIVALLSTEFQVAKDDIDRAAAYQTKNGGQLEKILVNMGALPSDALPEFYSLSFDLPLLNIADWMELPETGLEESTRKWLAEHNWVLLSKNGARWHFACLYPLEPDVHQWLAKEQIEYEVTIASDPDLQILISRQSMNSVGNEFSASTDDEKLIELAAEAPTVNLLNSLVIRGLRLGASDMHLEPHNGQYRVRYRIDGVLADAERVSPRLQMALITRLKILSGMDIAEKRRPQDGKIDIKIAGEELDIRVSALPLNDGESIVMRFLRKQSVRYDMSTLAMSDDIQQQIEIDLRATAGVILITGPTGSGKTTTLYTFLNALNTDGVKIVTLEDPVEYQLEGVNQVQINSEIGFNFASGLRSVVRQDPDVIMVGEIRDKETAQIALQSALTGHLVFSTVHTNDAPSAFTRLLDLGVDEFLLNAGLVSVLAQRLTRKLCEDCKQPLDAHEQNRLVSEYNLDELARRSGAPEISLYKPAGCGNCGGSGYKGRMAIIEYLACDDALKTMPKDANFLSEARAHNHALNRRNLLEDGLLKAIKGQTTVEEVLRVAG